jgi:hypothetical protein
VLSAGAKHPIAAGLRRIPIDDLHRCPSPLPDADAWRAGELDLPAGSFDRNAQPGFGSAHPVRAVGAQHIGEDGDRVVALEATKVSAWVSSSRKAFSTRAPRGLRCSGR